MDTFWWNRQFSTLGNLDGHLGLTVGGTVDFFNGINNVHALEDLSENNVLAIKPTNRRGLAIGKTQWAGEGRVLDCNSQYGIAVVSLLDFGGRIKSGSTYEVITVVMKNWEPLVSLPALAMLRRPGREC